MDQKLLDNTNLNYKLFKHGVTGTFSIIDRLEIVENCALFAVAPSDSECRNGPFNQVENVVQFSWIVIFLIHHSMECPLNIFQVWDVDG